MAPQSSTLEWKIPWMEEPGRLQSMDRRELSGDARNVLYLHLGDDYMDAVHVNYHQAVHKINRLNPPYLSSLN